MAKLISVNAEDAALNYVKTGTATGRLLIVSNTPTDYASAITNILAEVATPTINGPEDDGTDRRIEVQANNGVSDDAAGTALHACLVDDTGTELLAMTETNAEVFTGAGTKDLGAFSYRLPDAV